MESYSSRKAIKMFETLNNFSDGVVKISQYNEAHLIHVRLPTCC